MSNDVLRSIIRDISHSNSPYFSVIVDENTDASTMQGFFGVHSEDRTTVEGCGSVGATLSNIMLDTLLDQACAADFESLCTVNVMTAHEFN